MAEQYHGMAIGIFELDSECACFVALDAGKYFGCESCDGSGDPDGRANRKGCFTHGDCIPVRGDRNGDCNDDYKIRRD